MKNIIVKKSKINGYGVFAYKNIKAGEVIIKWDTGRTLTKKEIESLPKKEKKYLIKISQNKFILMQPPARYLNHSCEPNTKPSKLSDVAIKNIKRGEEITSDYTKIKGLDNFICRCGSKKCRKIINNKI